MAATLKISYDQTGDILYLDAVAPYDGQRTLAVGDGIVVRQNPESGVVENLEVWGFAARVSGEGGVEVPLSGRLYVTSVPSATG